MASSADRLAKFRVRFPEFVGETDARINLYIDDACEIFACCETPILYLAAHLLTLDNASDIGVAGSGGVNDGGNGVVASEAVGAVNTSYKNVADANTKDVFYETTPYGRRYIQGRNACPGYRVSVRSV